MECFQGRIYFFPIRRFSAKSYPGSAFVQIDLVQDLRYLLVPSLVIIRNIFPFFFVYYRLTKKKSPIIYA